MADSLEILKRYSCQFNRRFVEQVGGFIILNSIAAASDDGCIIDDGLINALVTTLRSGPVG